MCSDDDHSNGDASGTDRCPPGCQQMPHLELEDLIPGQENREGNLARSARAWLFPDMSRWQNRMLKTGIGSRSRSAGAYLRIGRDSSSSPESDPGRAASTDRRGGRTRSAGRYLRIGRDKESAEPEMAASGAALDDRKPEEQLADLLHLRKVNREVALEHDALSQP